MSTQEKQAWFVIWVIAAALVLYAALYALTRSLTISMAALSITALLGAQGLIGRKERKSGRIVADERDHEIGRTAGIVGWSVFWLFFVAAAMGPYFILGPNATLHITTSELTMVVYPAVLIVLLVRALVMIILYRKNHHA